MQKPSSLYYGQGFWAPATNCKGNDGQPVVFQTSMFGGIGEACIFSLCLNQHGKFNHSRVLSEQDSEGILINHESHLYIYIYPFIFVILLWMMLKVCGLPRFDGDASYAELKRKILTGL